jgi:tetratricopeptide (TPR) repeat protein
LNVLDKNSILLTYDYAFVYSSSLYYQQVEKLRPDVKVFNVKFLSAVWFLETLKKHYPDVYEVFKPEAEEYIKTYNIEDKNHSSRLMSLVKGFFEKSIKWFPVYLTVDCLISKEMAAFISAYSAEPDGLVYRLKEKNAAYNPDAGKLSLDAVFRKYEPLGFHKNKMFVSTPGVYYETAFYHYKNKNFQASMKFIDKALELNSGFRDALTLKNQINNESK